MFGQVTIGCNQNAEADLAGYRVYCATSPTLPMVVRFVQEFPLASLSDPTAPSMTCTTFPTYGLLYFVVTAYDTSGNESDWSAVVSMAVSPKLMPFRWP